jgi:hypothetical protein
MARTLASFCVIASSLLALTSSLCFAQRTKAEPPKQVTITRHTSFDFGPPFNFYAVIQLNEQDNRTYIQGALVTPGEGCFFETNVDESSNDR